MPEAPLPFLDNGIAQIAFVVEDLDRTVEMYHRTFGIGPWHFYTYGKPLVKQMTYHGEPADYKMRIALANAGDMRIELIEALEGDTVYADFIREHGYGIHHMAVLVDDILTTGATVSSAARALETEGWQVGGVLCLARTPHSRQDTGRSSG